MDKIKVLFICIHNSARSQMAEAILKQKGGGKFEVESAGLEPGTLNVLAVDAMSEIGIDISGNQTKSAFDLFKQGKLYRYVVTVCDESSAEKCPIFPGVVKRLHWSFEDPSSFEGMWDEKLARTRKVRIEIQRKIEAWIPSILKQQTARTI